MIPLAQELIASVDDLVSLPEICSKITQLVENPDSSIDEIAQVISQDPSLTIKVLRLSNSALYGLVSEVDTVSRAITVLGTRQIRDLVLATSAVNCFKDMANSLVSMEDFWSHSILTGLAANQITKHCGLRNGEGLFVAGLLHDIGQLILFNKLPDLSKQALEMSMQADGNSMHIEEKKIIGYDHMQVGNLLAEKWKLPKYLQYAIGYHHEPAKAPDYIQEVSIINIANSIAVMAELHSEALDDAPVIDDFAEQQLGLTTEAYKQIIENIADEFDEIEQLILL